MISPTANFDYEGKPLSVLENLIEKRKKILGETTKDAVVATAITVLKSLRADTRVAPANAPDTSYDITDTGYVGGWERVGGKFHRVARMSNNPKAPKVQNIYPVNLAGQRYEKGEEVRVYKIVPKFADSMKWEKTKHKGCWYVFAKSIGVVQRYAKKLMTSRIRRYRGLAKGALGFAMAAISTKGNYANDVKSTRATKAAMAAAQVFKVQEGDMFAIKIVDILNYSALALKSGKSGIQQAMRKAANAIAGRLKRVAGSKLGETIQTPFPETNGG